jgi:hypothetical protein
MEDFITGFIHNHLHLVIYGFVGYLIFQAIVGGMPPLPANASYSRVWFYGTMHALALNWQYGLRLLHIPLPPDKDASDIVPKDQK